MIMLDNISPFGYTKSSLGYILFTKGYIYIRELRGKFMTTRFEKFDLKRKKYRQGYLIWLAIFSIAWIIRSVLKIYCLEMALLESIILGILLLSVLLQAFYVFQDSAVKKEMRDDPKLKEAMNDELVQLNELKAWKIAFFSLVGFIIFAALLSLFVQINDLMLIYITALLIGFGSYNTAVFMLNR
jgi:hypothetical protein